MNILGYDGLTWVIPFFSFVLLVALGIDYSIFLMDRFNEYKNGFIKDALINAMKNMGTVIISATIILGGTFGAMLPSGVLSLLQIATVVIIGLVYMHLSCYHYLLQSWYDSLENIIGGHLKNK